jgi:hypothetical protein
MSHELADDPYNRYIPLHPFIPERFRGIAIRVEDIVQITEGGKQPIVLTKSAPKEIADIESLRV